ncbi:hypothetical protein [Zeaxanthinibacter enoshimensis]|uniref:6-bladed beta-propeller protein n=1 Tax=Zeaxanthinibacter enoshimensis TaxID=392009 RepID=A0A4R6TUN0_9FLAO|nr:hypothetical protein [Zeaxanthinibacter enoshimensis]TDQ32638.1 hypothetical protein CLV82_0471 [Zeaxanthinibacter enoshimensis]
MRNLLAQLLLVLGIACGTAQQMPVNYTFGEKFNDKYRYSNLLSSAEDGSGGYVLVRAYYTGLILTPKGYFIEQYDSDLNLVSEVNYKLKGKDFVEGYVSNGQVYLLFLQYNPEALAYEYVVHRSPVGQNQFTVEKLLTIPSEFVNNPLDRNYYNRNFSSGFTTTVLFDDARSAFVISTHYKKNKVNKHAIHVFDTSLRKLMEHDFSAEVEDKNYAFENLAVSPDLGQVFIVGKAYYKKKRFSALERKFQYELIKLDGTGHQVQTFDIEDKYSESLKPLWHEGEIICVGFYADRKDNRYNGLSYFRVDPRNLEITTRKYNAFSPQFMFDKFGKENAKFVKDLVFKNVSFGPDNDILFNAEEYFVTTSTQANSSGGRLRVERFHYNDIVSARLDAEGNMAWARNINKTEVTQGDGAYASYSSYTLGGNTYFFISTASENPQLLNRERLIFKQGFSRNRNVFVIRLDEQGKMDYEKIIDNEEARLPLMVSKPLIDHDDEELLFYAKRGSKKQLVRVEMR